MEAREYIQHQFASVRQGLDNVLADLTDEQLNWTPPGKTNVISATLVHIFASEDLFVQTLLQGKPRVWEAGWAAEIGSPNPPVPNKGWEEFRSVKLSVASIVAYGKAARAATDSYLAGLSAAELDRTIDFFGHEMTVAGLLALSARHTAEHTGDISALKGVFGVKGLPI
jgi:uncharacterized damage-inducible protein DinB